MNIKSLITVLAIIPWLSATAQSTQKFTANKINEYGLVYSLPKTVVDLVVETRYTEKNPGSFVNYAKRHLAIDNAIRESSKSVEVLSVTVVPRGIPNDSSKWSVQFKSGSPVTMILTDGGIPLTINSETPAKAEPVKLPVAVPAQPTPLETEAARQAVTAEMSRSTTLSKKAELAAQRIFELREQRNELISGNADNMPPDGSALKVAIAGLDAQEAALTAMFAGTTKTNTQVQTFTYTPGTEDVFDEIVARISPVDGVVADSDLSGIPLSISIKVLSRGELPVNEKGETKRFPRGGIAYNIPGSARITVAFNGKDIASEDIELAQLGTVFGIDPALFSSKREPMSAIFSPITGAITELTPVNAR